MLFLLEYAQMHMHRFLCSLVNEEAMIYLAQTVTTFMGCGLCTGRKLCPFVVNRLASTDPSLHIRWAESGAPLCHLRSALAAEKLRTTPDSADKFAHW